MTHSSGITSKFRSTLAFALAAALVWGPGAQPLPAQIAGTTSQIGPKSLHIDILEGEGASNNIRQRDAREPVIQVTDENHKPVAGAAVVFLIHGGGNGGSATFAGQASTYSTTTGADGIAHAPGLQVGQAPGSFTISVSATVGQVVAQAVIHQANVLTALSTATTASTVAQHGILHLGAHAIAIGVGTTVVVGTVVGVVAATRGNPGTSVTLGTGTVGPPGP